MQSKESGGRPREFIDFGLKIKSVDERGEFEGYGSVFGVEDSYSEVVAPGAFERSLKELKSLGRMPAMLWQHRWQDPIGVYTEVKEDNVGLHVVGKLAMKTRLGAEAHELMQMGAIDGLSIGFIPRKEEIDNETGVITLTDIDLWEVSLVTFPANSDARVQEVKKRVKGITSIREAETYLRDAGGFSRAEAAAFMSRLRSLSDPREAGGDAGLVDSLQRLTQSFK